MLRYEIGGINDPGMKRVTQVFCQLAPDHVERATLVMAFEVLDVLQQERRRAVMREFGAALVERYGITVDVALHGPHREGDQRNHHTHGRDGHELGD